jgi:hypothetical protein
MKKNHNFKKITLKLKFMHFFAERLIQSNEISIFSYLIIFTFLAFFFDFLLKLTYMGKI